MISGEWVYSDTVAALWRSGDTVLDRFQAVVARSGDSPFLLDGETRRRYTYVEFDRYTNRVANTLLSVGVKHSDHVAVYSPSAFLLASVMISCWKTGAIYCPIGDQLRSDMLAYTLNDLKPSFIVTDPAGARRLHETGDRVDAARSTLVVVASGDAATVTESREPAPARAGFREVDCAELAQNDVPPPLPNIGLDDCASVIYSSGTTASPKGVILSHRWLRGVACSLGHMTHPDDVIYSDLPLYHIGGAFTNVVRAAWSGASVALWNRFSPSEFWSRIHYCQASIAILLDVMVDWLLALPPTPLEADNSLIRLHMQPLRKNHREVARRFGVDLTAVGYGSTELGVVFAGLIDESGRRPATRPWKGFSKDEIRARVADLAGPSAILGHDEKVPDGFMGAPLQHFVAQLGTAEDAVDKNLDTGRLAIKARPPAALFTGYLNVDRAGSGNEQGFLTHDIVCRNADGTYCFVARSEGFFRVRGENVSARAVEDSVANHPDVAACVALRVPPASGGEDAIAAFVVLKPGASVSENGLGDWIEKRLPRYMQPTFLRFVSEFPLTPTLKVARHELRHRFLADQAGAQQPPTSRRDA